MKRGIIINLMVAFGFLAIVLILTWVHVHSGYRLQPFRPSLQVFYPLLMFGAFWYFNRGVASSRNPIVRLLVVVLLSFVLAVTSSTICLVAIYWFFDAIGGVSY